MSTYIAEEVAHGRLKPPPVSLPGGLHVSPIGIIPKASQPGKFRLICDLSSPQGFSVNARIDSSLCSLQYATVEHVVMIVKAMGEGAQLDLQSVYCMVPVHTLDQPKLSIEWQGTIYCDQALPFGLHSAPIILTAVADGLSWALSCNSITNFIHYLDDFLFIGPPSSEVCAEALQIALPLCARLRLPVAPNKVDGPSTVLTFLGIEIDTVRQELRLPQNKMERICTLLREWAGRQNPTKRQLQSLIGQLSTQPQW